MSSSSPSDYPAVVDEVLLYVVSMLAKRDFDALAAMASVRKTTALDIRSSFDLYEIKIHDEDTVDRAQLHIDPIVDGEVTVWFVAYRLLTLEHGRWDLEAQLDVVTFANGQHIASSFRGLLIP